MPRKLQRQLAAARNESDEGEDNLSARPTKVASEDVPNDSGAIALRKLVDGLAAQLAFPLDGEGGTDSLDSAVQAAVRSEIPELQGALRQLQQRVAALRTAAGSALDRFAPAPAPKGGADADGASAYVEMKVQMLLSYIICLVYYLLLKTRGAPVGRHPVVLRLLWIRTLLEKLKPVDQRLQYQVGKLLQWADAKPATAGVADLRSLRPGELAAGVEDEDIEGAAEGEAAAAPAKDDGIYRPPRIAQVEYTGDHVSLKEKAERDLERKRGRLERSDFMRSLREEFTDAPAEIHGSLKSAKAERAARLMAEQLSYEEDHMLRLRTSKKEARARQRVLREGRATGGGVVSLDDATADFRELARARAGEALGRGRKRKGGSALQEYQDAVDRARSARNVVASALDGVPTRRRGGGGGGFSKGKRKRH